MKSRRAVLMGVLMACGYLKAQVVAPHGVVVFSSGTNTGPHPKLTPEEFNLEVIKHIMASPSPLQIGSIQLHRMGDHAATYIQQVLKTKPPVSGVQTQTILDMIHKAYEKPIAISKPEDRGTTATLGLLQTLADSTQDFSIRLRIADEQAFALASSASKIEAPAKPKVIGPPPAPGTTPFN